MKKHETVPSTPMTAGQLKELASALVESIPTDLRSASAQYWIGKKKKLAEEVRKIFAEEKGISAELLSWIVLYREEFGIELDLTSLALPAETPNTWLTIADERVTNNQVYDACRKHFVCSRYADDLNTIRDLHVRGTIARRFKAVIEADEENANKSANDIETNGLGPKAITLKERMLLELWYFRTTGNHLDMRNWTICAGSRHPVGLVPYVHWGDDGHMYVGWHDADYRYGDERARLAIS